MFFNSREKERRDQSKGFINSRQGKHKETSYGKDKIWGTQGSHEAQSVDEIPFLFYLIRSFQETTWGSLRVT